MMNVDGKKIVVVGTGVSGIGAVKLRRQEQLLLYMTAMRNLRKAM